VDEDDLWPGSLGDRLDDLSKKIPGTGRHWNVRRATPLDVYSIAD